jgi:Rrf2 family transcriptional regulator, cysteine metabolism repressor
MTELARSHGHGLLSLAEISRTELLPLAYLEQLIGELRRAGLVEGVRGLHGGYRLTRPPTEITVGEVYRVLEGPIAPVECTADDYLPHSCEREAGCLSRSVWERVQQSITAVLDSTTLDDLCNEKQSVSAGRESGLIAIETITGARAAVREGCLKTP